MLFGLEIERTLTKIQKIKKTVDLDMTEPNQDQDQPRPLREYVNPLVNGIHQNINRPTIQDNNFELKSLLSKWFRILSLGELLLRSQFYI